MPAGGADAEVSDLWLCPKACMAGCAGFAFLSFYPGARVRMRCFLVVQI